MSFKTALKINGKELNVLYVDYDLNQETNVSGAPSSIVRGGKITLILESIGDSFFFEWMTSSFERKKGSIVFLRPDTEATLKEVFFEDAYLINYNESFNHKGKNPLTEEIIISARVLSCGGGEIVNEWPN